MPLYLAARQYPKPIVAFGRLGAVLTPDQAAKQAMPTVNNTPGFTQAVYNDIVQAAQSGNFDIPLPASCTGQGGAPSGARLAQVAGVASGAATKIGLLIPALATGPGAIVVAGVAAAINIFGALFAHHGQAVAAEQRAICASVPAAMDGLTAIEQAVSDGTITPAEGITMLNNLQSQFLQTIGPVTKNNSSQCNAGCVWTKMMNAIVLELTSQWQNMAAPQSPNAATGSAASSGSAVSTTPSWLPWAAAAGLLFFLSN
jgi:hypothetical protein